MGKKGLSLYHGTDARMVEMTMEERQQYLACCNLVIDNLYPYYIPLMQQELVERQFNGQTIYVNEPYLKRYENLLNEKGESNLYSNLYDKLMMIEGRNNGNELYQYNDLYLTDSKQKAMDYARRSYAGGEIGLNAYRFILGAEIINFENYSPNDKFKRAINTIKEFAKEGNERPVIVTIEDVDIDELFYEDGRRLDDYDIKELYQEGGVPSGLAFRYKKAIELSMFKIEYVNEELFKQINKEYEF